MTMIDKVLQALLTPLMIVLLVAPGSALAQSADQDPFESFNRKIFAFNDTADTYVMRPLAKGYRAVTPDPVERSISRFFSNLWEVNSVFNSVLQAKFGQAAHHSGRFLLNSTVGVLGFFEVAEPMGLARIEREDFGQTLGAWGVRSGPYLVVPLLGPSTLRDAPSTAIDVFFQPIGYVDHVPTRNTLYGTELLVLRADLIPAEELISGDKYVFMREAYLQRREYLVNDGVLSDDFGDDDYGDLDDDGEYDF